MKLIAYLQKFYRGEFRTGDDPKRFATELFKREELTQGVWSSLIDGEDVPEAKIHAMRKRLLSSDNINTEKDTDMAQALDDNGDSIVAKAFHMAAPGYTPSAQRGWGGPTVKAPSERYSEKRYVGHHRKSGREVFHEGQVVTTPSEKNFALTGAYFKHLARRRGLDVAPLTEHEQELVKEIYNDHDWVGDVGGQYIPGAKLSQIFHTKGNDLINDSLSGGEYLVPYFFDVDVITFALLNGEIFPYVTVKDLTWSNSVHTGSIANPTMAWSGSEGSDASIPLETTDGLVASITANVYNVAAAITIGRDFLSDSPVSVGEELHSLFGQRYLAELDKVIAVGDGSTQPEGLTNASGTIVYTSKNGSAGPFVVSDVEGMIKTLPKQYRGQKHRCAWLMNDSTWFVLRGISVSGSDQRRIFGYDYENYTLANRPVMISADLPATFMSFFRPDLYRMYRRMGLQIQTSMEGKTLMQNNELLIVARGRFAGKMMNGVAAAVCTTTPKTS